MLPTVDFSCSVLSECTQARRALRKNENGGAGRLACFYTRKEAL